MTQAAKKIYRTFSGRVVSDKNDKTIVVEVKNTKMNPKYLKQFGLTKKFKVHDPENKFKVGETVTFVECRPLSRDKRWRVIYPH